MIGNANRGGGGIPAWVVVAVAPLAGCDARIGQPHALWALWALPALAVFYLLSLRTRNARLRRFASPAMIERLTGGASVRRGVTKAVLVALAVAALLLALAQLQIGYTWEEVERRGVDIVIALDVSDSMRVEDAGRALPRLERAKREIHDLLAMMSGDRVGIVAFAGVAFVQCPMTLDYGAAELFLDALDSESMPVQGTDLAQALETSLAAFRGGAAGSRAILLITDGEDHSGRAVEVAKRLAGEGVRVFAIGIGSEEGAPIPAAGGGFRRDRNGSIILSRLDEPTLQQIALTTDGRYVRSVTGDLDLEQIYVDGIKASLEEREFDAHRRQRWEDRFQWLVAVALAALMIDGLLPDAASRRQTRVRSMAAAARPTATASGGWWRRRWWRRSKRGGQPAPAPGTVAAALALAIVTGFAPRVGAAVEEKASGQASSPPAPQNASSRAAGEQASSTAAAKRFDTPEAAYAAGAYDQALEGFLELQVERPQDAAVMMNVGSSHYRLGDLQAAGKSFEGAGAAGDDRVRAQAWYDLGNVAYRQNRFEAAIDDYHRSLDLDPNDQDAKFNLEVARAALERQQQQQQQQQEQQKQQQQQQQPQSGGQQPPPQQGDDQQQGAADRSQSQQERDEQQRAEREQDRTGESRDAQPEAGDRKSGNEQSADDRPDGAAAGTLTPAEAQRLLDSLEEGRPHRRVPPGRHHDQEKDW